MSEKNTPEYTVHYEVKVSAEKSIWPKCGVAWSIKDGDGLKIHLDAMPVGSNELFLFKPGQKE